MGRDLKLFTSQVYAEFLAFWNSAYVQYHHINNNGYWEFMLKDELGDVIYRSKGLRNE